MYVCVHPCVVAVLRHACTTVMLRLSRCFVLFTCGSVPPAVYLSVGPIGQNFTVSVTEACARRPGAAASVSRRQRERRNLLAGGGRRASRSHTLAASQAFERMHTLSCHRVKHLNALRYVQRNHTIQGLHMSGNRCMVDPRGFVTEVKGARAKPPAFPCCI